MELLLGPGHGPVAITITITALIILLPFTVLKRMIMTMIVTDTVMVTLLSTQ
jgi:hypothetical protein